LAVLDFGREQELACTVGVMCDFCTSEAVLSQVKRSRADVLITGVGPVVPKTLFKESMSTELVSDLVQLFADDPLYAESFGAKDAGELQTLPSMGGSSHPCYNGGEAYACVGLEGLLRIADSLRGQETLVVVADLPVDLGDKRHRIAAILNDAYGGKPRFLTEDIGLVVGMPDLDVMCEFHHDMVPAADVSEQCLEGDLLGPVKHFLEAHRKDERFDEFLSADF
jgi:hypothetical protein